MGFESFQVVLHGGTATPHQVLDTVRRLPHARPDPEAIPTHGSTYFTIEDGSHVLELEVVESPLRISCRFTLCHPPTVELALAGVVQELMTRLGMKVSLLDDDLQWFSITQFAEFTELLHRSVSVARVEWIAQFGPMPCAARTREAFERYILPRCEPATKSA